MPGFCKSGHRYPKYNFENVLILKQFEIVFATHRKSTQPHKSNSMYVTIDSTSKLL